MKISKSITIILIITLLALAVASQISQETTTINVEESKACNTIFYDEVEKIYGNCVYYHNYTSCLNASGPNTDCSLQQSSRTFSCKTGERLVTKNITNCRTNKFTILIDKGSRTEKNEVDFSDWGVCVQETENNCIAIICGTLQGGSARNSIFNGCDGGKSCQKFLFCKDGTKVLYKAAREDFVEEDPTFKLSKLAYREVGK